MGIIIKIAPARRQDQETYREKAQRILQGRPAVHGALNKKYMTYDLYKYYELYGIYIYIYIWIIQIIPIKTSVIYSDVDECWIVSIAIVGY